MKGIIVAGGLVDLAQLKNHIEDCDIVVGVDRGLEFLRAINHKPQVLIGDLDSIDEFTMEWVKSNDIRVLKFPKDKDKTDTELGLDYLIGRNVDIIKMFGCTGSRIDHMMSNISSLRMLSQNKTKGIIIDDHNQIEYIDSILSIEKKPNHFVSIIPISLDGITINLKGFYYDLNRKYIPYGSSLGISNYIIEKNGEVELISGEALLIISRD